MSTPISFTILGSNVIIHNSPIVIAGPPAAPVTVSATTTAPANNPAVSATRGATAIQRIAELIQLLGFSLSPAVHIQYLIASNIPRDLNRRARLQTLAEGSAHVGWSLDVLA
ncbi:hypothetical protein B0H14DRAFT_2581899 [Mycena olivaceomarginata]|nr:hypothetical protein B0H14DRAFT_2581899 [Mycena olivaceomarginata]